MRISHHGLVCPIEPGSLASDAEVMAAPTRYPLYAATAAWLRERITQPHPDLGRAGPVCPFVSVSIKKGLMRYATVRTTDVTAEHCAQRCRHLINTFYDAFPDSADHTLAALLVHFPDLPRVHAATFIDGGHRLLRLDFVRHGLMVGEFHMHSSVPGTYNPDFHAMHAPMPLFAIRTLSDHDLAFLVREDFPLSERREYFDHFEYHLGATLNPASRQRLNAQKQRLLSIAGGDHPADLGV